MDVLPYELPQLLLQPVEVRELMAIPVFLVELQVLQPEQLVMGVQL
jgi:hypothetical protein